MYQSFYELNKKPFQISADPLFLWMGEKHQEALSMLKYGIMDNRGFIMLTGDVGMGKTTLINALTGSLGPNVIIANITDPGLERLEFLNHIAAAFGMGNTFAGKGEFLLGFRTFLEKCFRDGKQVLLIIDEAQRLSQEMLEEIRLLSNIEHQDVKLLNIFFVGQDELNGILDRHENRALRHRMTLQYHLEPLSEQEIGDFVEHRLKIAGARKKIFSKDAIREIYVFSKGYPRLTNIICDHAMLTGYVANRKTIDAAEIRDCAEDLKLPRIADVPPLKEKVQAPEPRQLPKKSAIYEEHSFTYLLPYITGFLFAILLICFLYFPIRAGASFSDILNYWMDQISDPKLAISKQVTETQVPQATFKVRGDAGWAAGQTDDGEGPKSGSAEAPKSGDGETVALESGEETRIGRVENQKIGSLDDQNPVNNSVRQSDSPSVQPPVRPAVQQKQIIPEIEKHYTLVFGFDSNDLTPEGYERLNKTAALLENNPDIALIISGHTDAVGSNSYNLMLSKFRADIVKNYLVSKGVDPQRIVSIGKGAEEPVAGNDDLMGRRSNRRVEVEMAFE